MTAVNFVGFGHSVARRGFKTIFQESLACPCDICVMHLHLMVKLAVGLFHNFILEGSNAAWKHV